VSTRPNNLWSSFCITNKWGPAQSICITCQQPAIFAVPNYSLITDSREDTHKHNAGQMGSMTVWSHWHLHYTTHTVNGIPSRTLSLHTRCTCSNVYVRQSTGTLGRRGIVSRRRSGTNWNWSKHRPTDGTDRRHRSLRERERSGPASLARRGRAAGSGLSCGLSEAVSGGGREQGEDAAFRRVVGCYVVVKTLPTRSWAMI